jgi:hypothetical protein
LAAIGLGRRNPRLVPPAVAALFEVRESRQLRHRIDVEVRQGEHDRLDAGQGEVTGFQRRCRSPQAAVTTLNDLSPLRPVGGAQNLSDLAGRPNDVPTRRPVAGVGRREGYPAEAYSVGVAGQAGAAPFHQPKRPDSLENHVKLPSQ